MAYRISLLAPAVAALLAASPALGADYLRGGFTPGWEPEEEDSLSFEIGTRYWYSLGAQSFSIGPGNFSSSDQAHALEAHFRIDDAYTNTFLKGTAGYSVLVDGSTDVNGTVDAYDDGHIGYAGADFGWYAFGDPNNGFGIGAVAGYQYSNDFVDADRFGYTTATTESDVTWSDVDGSWSVGYDSRPNNLNVSALRLGATAKATLSDMFDVTAELVGVPFAWVSGTAGSLGVADVSVPGQTTIQSSPTEFSGYAFGGTGELMLGFHPAENFTIRVGGRASYLGGQVDGTWRTTTITDPQNADADPDFEVPPVVTTEDYISTSNPFSLFRYGALVELTYAF
jgi:hypothetical protein